MDVIFTEVSCLAIYQQTGTAEILRIINQIVNSLEKIEQGLKVYKPAFGVLKDRKVIVIRSGNTTDTENGTVTANRIQKLSMYRSSIEKLEDNLLIISRSTVGITEIKSEAISVNKKINELHTLCNSYIRDHHQVYEMQLAVANNNVYSRTSHHQGQANEINPFFQSYAFQGQIYDLQPDVANNTPYSRYSRTSDDQNITNAAQLFEGVSFLGYP